MRLEKGLAGALAISKVWRLVIALYLLVVPSGVYKWSINPFTKPNPIYSHTLNCDNMYGLKEVNTEKTKYMLLSCHQNARQNQDIKIGNMF
jgi:hypothetical protein